MNILMIDCVLPSLDKFAGEHDIRHARWNGQGALVPVHYFIRQVSRSGEVFRPDILVQREHLGRRLLLGGLWKLDCPKIFWAVDSHLNLFWQQHYARLFDLVLTPHARLFANLSPDVQAARCLPFTWPGVERTWRPHGLRQHTASFVGVLDTNRIHRLRFTSFLKEQYDITATSMPFADMLDLYTDTRLLPNESICQEFNFRIMEGASCGCCVVTEDIGDDLAVNFEPGKEVLTYRHVFEFDELFRFLLARPQLAEKIGKAAHERVARCHTEAHRSRFLLETCAALSATRRESRQARLDFALALAELGRGEPACAPLLKPAQDIFDEEPEDWRAAAMSLRLCLEGLSVATDKESWRARAIQLCGALAARAPALAASARLDAALLLYAAAVRLEDPLWLGECRRLLPDVAWDREGSPSDSHVQTALVLARHLGDARRTCRPGFKFDPRSHCPDSAIELLLLAEGSVRDEQERCSLLAVLSQLSQQSPLRDLALDSGARYTLRARPDWRITLDYALCNLRAFRLKEGLEEALLAQIQAQEAGAETRFAAAATAAGLRLPRS